MASFAVRLLGALLLFAPALALAQPIQPVPPIGGGGGGGGCTTNCTFTGTTTTGSLNASGAISGSVGQFSGPINSSNGSAVLQFNGATAMRFGAPNTSFGGLSQALFIGQLAGAASSLAADPYSAVGVGTGALMALTALGSEDTALGSWACHFVVSGGLATCLGMHAIGEATAATGDTAIGNDAERDSFPAGYTVSIGQHSNAHGAPGGNVIAIGSQAMRGNSAAILIGGTPTVGSTITYAISASGSTPVSVIGLPFSRTYTVLAGDTLATIATAISTAINASGISGIDISLAAITANYGTAQSVVSLQFTGTTTVGWALNVTASASSGETVTVLPGSNPQQMVVIGGNSATGEAMNAPVQITSVGDASIISLQTGAFDTFFGNNVADNLISGNQISIFGSRSGQSLFSTAGNIAIFGAGSGQALVNAGGVTLVGTNVGNTCNGATVILVGNGNRVVDCPSSSTTDYVNVGNVLIASTGTVLLAAGFGTSPSVPSPANPTSAAFTVNVGTGGTASTGQINFATAAPTGWACDVTDSTNPGIYKTVSTPLNANRVNLTNYAQATGAAVAWAASDILVVKCNGY